MDESDIVDMFIYSADVLLETSAVILEKYGDSMCYGDKEMLSFAIEQMLDVVND